MSTRSESDNLIKSNGSSTPSLLISSAMGIDGWDLRPTDAPLVIVVGWRISAWLTIDQDIPTDDDRWRCSLGSNRRKTRWEAAAASTLPAHLRLVGCRPPRGYGLESKPRWAAHGRVRDVLSPGPPPPGTLLNPFLSSNVLAINWPIVPFILGLKI